MGSRILKPKMRKTILAFDIFEKWGIDAVGPITITQCGKCYILIAMDYLSRWVEVRVVKQVTANKSQLKMWPSSYMRMCVADMECLWNYSWRVERSKLA